MSLLSVPQERRVTVARVELNLSQGELGKRCSLSRQAINAIENGATPRVRHAIRISKVLGHSVEDLFGHLEGDETGK